MPEIEPRRRGPGVAVLGAMVLACVAAVAAVARMTSRGLPSPLVRACDGLADRSLGGLYDVFAADAVRVCPAGEVLEIGGGTGLLAARLLRSAPGVRLHGVELADDMVRLSTERAEREGMADRASFEVGDVAELRNQSASADLVISSLSFHHWQKPVRGLAEIHRVLRPGARAILWDLPDALARIEGRRSRLESAVSASPFVSGHVSRIRWPGPLRILVRLELQRLP